MKKRKKRASSRTRRGKGGHFCLIEGRESLPVSSNSSERKTRVKVTFCYAIQADKGRVGRSSLKGLLDRACWERGLLGEKGP